MTTKKKSTGKKQQPVRHMWVELAEAYQSGEDKQKAFDRIIGTSYSEQLAALNHFEKCKRCEKAYVPHAPERKPMKKK